MTLDYVEWFVWRPVKAKWATLQEIETHWSLADLAKAHQLLDIDDEAEAFESRKVEQEMNRAKRGR